MRLVVIKILVFFLVFIAVSARANLPSQVSIQNIPVIIQQRMQNNSWYQGCPVSLQQLAYVTVPYWGFDHQPHRGALIVNNKIAHEIVDIFQEMYAAKFLIEKVRPIYFYGGDDNRSMADNNTSAFNCRLMADSSQRLSLHSYGVAIDVNPLINPYVRQNRVLPPHGKNYLNRNKNAPGMINRNSVIYQAFMRHGWSWGGNWRYTKDYAHFEKNIK